MSRDHGGYQIKVEDGPWPAFPADLTSIAVALATQSEGAVLMFEKMFENRLVFTDKLVAMGANIILCDPHRAVISGATRLRGSKLVSPDIRAGMAMLIAALCAEGESRDRLDRADRPRLRAHRRAPARARRADRARRGLAARPAVGSPSWRAGPCSLAPGRESLTRSCRRRRRSLHAIAGNEQLAPQVDLK